MYTIERRNTKTTRWVDVYKWITYKTKEMVYIYIIHKCSMYVHLWETQHKDYAPNRRIRMNRLQKR